MQQKTPDIMPELLTIEQFAKRLHIGRSTAYGWLASGRLLVGVHYLHIGRVVRIIWNDALMEHLLQLSVTENREQPRIRLHRSGKGGRNRVAINFDYLEL